MTPVRSDENRVYLSGRITEEPVLKYTTKSKTPVLRITLAVNSYIKDTKETLFIPLVIWSDLAIECSSTLKRGTSVKVEGRLVARKWDDLEGKTHKIVEVAVSKIEIIV